MGILGRKVFYSVVKGKIVFADMAIVQTQMGEMVEPLNLAIEEHEGVGIDMADEIAMITELIQVDPGKFQALSPFVDEGTQIHAVNMPKGW